MNEAPSPEEQLRKRYPDMKPISGVPSLFTLNGFGLSMAGSRDKDLQLGTFVKSHVITLLFIPVFTLGSYVVSHSEDGGFYFLGKVGKSGFAKFWNTFLALAIAGFIGLGFWNAKQNSPDNLAKKQLAEAAELAGSGDHLAAAGIYHDHLQGNLPRQEEALKGLKSALTSATGSDQPTTVEKAIRTMALIPRLDRKGDSFLDEMATLALEKALSLTDTDPRGAIGIIESLDRFPDERLNLEKIATERRALLVTATTAYPDDPELASKLATILEREEKLDEAFQLLEPHVDRLGDLEGGRILGQIMLNRGSPEIASKLLEKYTLPRIEKWQIAEKSYNSQVEKSYNRILESLNRNEGPSEFYEAWEAAPTEEKKSEIVDRYIYPKIQEQSSFKRSLATYEEASAIVPVMMDLGISELQSAQASDDPAQRKELLERAEDRFLSLQASSGDSAEYKFFLGQVYFWSGRQDEGRQLFDEILANSNRSFENLITLARTLREIGDTTEARKLGVEAFEKAGATPEQKDSAASFLALIATDIDEQISWLEKVTNKDLAAKTRLAESRGHQLVSEGKNEEAIKNFTEAADGWANLPLSSSTMNNAALVQSTLYNLTGDISYYEKGSEFMERAVKLESNNSIVLGNATTFLMTTAIMQVIGDKVHPRLVQEGAGINTLRLLYTDEKSREPLLEELRKNSNFQKTLEFINRAILLAPNSKDHYTTSLVLHSYLKNEDALKLLLKNLEAARFDDSEGMAALEELLSGQNDTKIREGREQALSYQQNLLAEIDDSTAQQAVIANLSDSRMSAFTLGDPVDYDTEIETLKKAMEKAPSTRIHSSLKKAYLQKACVELATISPSFRKLLESTRRILDPETILTLGLTSETLRPEIVAHPGVQKAFEIVLEVEEKFPGFPDASTVIFARHFKSDDAKRLQSGYAANRTNDLSAQINRKISGWHPSTMISNAIHYLALDQSGEAAAFLTQAKEKGVFLPD